MKVDELNISPITTPEHADLTEIRRYIRDDHDPYGFDTVFVEEVTWDAVCEPSTTCASISTVNFQTQTLPRRRAITSRASSPAKYRHC